MARPDCPSRGTAGTMDLPHPRPKGAAMCPSSLRCLLAIGILAATDLALNPVYAAGSTEISRCTAADGSVEFRQGPCDARTQEQTLTIEDRPTGWVAPKVPTELLEVPTKPRNRLRQDAAAGRAAETQKRQCWEKRQRLEEVENRLRHGYKAKQGMALKQRRDYYEAYLDEFCER